MSSAWHQARNLLCVRLDAVGDVLMTTPALRALKESAPGRRLTLLASSGGARIAGLVPEIDEVWVYDAPWLKATAPRQDTAPEYAMAERLRGARFDGAVIFTVFTQSPLPTALLCLLAGIPLRAAHCRENPYQLLTDWIPDRETLPNPRHEVERQLALVEALGSTTENTRLSLHVPAAARWRVREMLSRRQIDAGRPWLVLHPGASAPSRRYPPELFAQVARELVRRAGFQLVFTGGTDETGLVETIRRGIRGRTCSLAGQLELADLAALLEAAPLLLSNNTGPVHLAAALGTPVVDLYALTNPQHTPWGVPCRVLYHDVPCRNCLKSICPQGHHDCLRGIAPSTVVDAVLDLMREQVRAA